MDSFTERMLERAKARQKKLEKHFHNTNESPKTPLQEPNTILQKYENPSGLTKSQPNLSECNKLPRKETASDSNLNFKTQFYDPSMKENLSDSNLSKKSMTRVSSDLQIHPQSPTKTLNIQKENFNMEIKLTSADNVRVEVEIEERDESEPEDDSGHSEPQEVPHIFVTDESDSQNKTSIRPDVKNRLQRLGKLYSGADEIQLSSPISRTEEKFYEEDIEKDAIKPSAGLDRLKALASTRNQWEDEVSSSTNKPVTTKETPKKSWKPPAPKPPAPANVFTHSPNKGPAPQPPKSVVSTKINAKIPSRDSSPEKNAKNEESSAVSWDNSVLASLESQGFTRTNSNTRLVYSYKNGEENAEEGEPLEDVEEVEEIEEPPPPPVSKISKITSKFFSSSKTAEKTPPSPKKSPSKSSLRTGEVLNKAAKFENQRLLSPAKTKDPALLSVSERKALFEKNKGAALVPKAAFAMAAPLKNTEKDAPAPGKSVTTKSSSSHKFTQEKPSSPKKTTSSSCVTSPTKSYIAESGGIASKMKALLEKKSTISQSTIANSIQEQRQKDLDLLLNRFHKNQDQEEDEEKEEQSSEAEEDEEDDPEEGEIISETTKMLPDRSAKIVHFKEKGIPPPPPPPVPLAKPGGAKRRSKGDSPKVREVLEDVKRIRVSPPKAGRMYPCLSDIEASTENEQEATTAEPSPDSSYDENCSLDSDEPNTSFGREILQVVTKNQTPQKRPNLNDSTASELSDILDGMDDYLDEAMAHEADSDYDEGPTPPKLGRSIPASSRAAPSNSFHFSKSSPRSKNPTPAKKEYSPKKSSELPTHVVEGENLIPLTHTVSFYRKQQAQGSRTPVRQITRQPILTEESPMKQETDNSLEVSEKIQDLMNTVSKQQTVISQASQALNLCCSTIEFSGSSEQVEAERLLLVATQRRQAALHEVQRLRVEGTLHPGGDAFVDKGTLSISDITLPLKKEYVRALSAAGGQGHHVVCLIRNAEHVIPTRLVSTFASPKDAPELKLRIPGSIKLENIYSDFTVTVEVYSLQAQEELLPHDVKYHINIKKSGSKHTPKKKNDSKLIMPAVQSPAGPQAVRSPSFALVGYVVFSVQGINRKQWTLNNAPAMSPLEGIIQMRVHCELAVSVEHRGFLTMFDDVSGFGAWHRRWCLLKGHSLSYWKYPDDEKKKAPIDSINIQICTTKKLGLVSRDICARPNTFLLETVRPAKASDKDSLVTVLRGDNTIIRHLLSADTKEERLEWCEKFNKALNSIRLWKNN